MDEILKRLDEIDAILATPPERLRQELLDERDTLLDQLCEVYLATTPRQRPKIRRFFERKERLLEALADRVARASYLVKGPGDVDRLRLGLVAMSINDARTDFRDLTSPLRRLIEGAARAGIDPKPHLLAVAEMSNRKGRGDGSMCSWLRHLSGS